MDSFTDYFWYCGFCNHHYHFVGNRCIQYCSNCGITSSFTGEWCEKCVDKIDCLQYPSAKIFCTKFSWGGVQFSLSTTIAIKDLLEREVEKHSFYHKFIKNFRNEAG